MHVFHNKQGRKQMCSRRWARLENLKMSPIIDMIEISILVHSKQITNYKLQISVVSESDKQKKKKKKGKKKEKKKGGGFLCSFSYFYYNFPSFPLHIPFSFFSLPLFSLSSSFSLSLPFSSFLPSFQNVPQTFQGWATRPPLVTPLTIKYMKRYFTEDT